MKNMIKKISLLAVVVMMVMAFAVPAFAEESTTAAAETTVEASGVTDVSGKAISAAVVVGVAAAAGALAMGIAIAKSAESIARQPESSGDIRTSLMLGLVFIETAIIYALIVAILIVFVLT